MRQWLFNIFTGYSILILSFTTAIASADHRVISKNGYVVGPGDILEIQIWDHDDLNREIEISSDGSFSFPLIGKIDATNLSINDIEKKLTEKLGDGYLVAPQISVTVIQYNNKKVFLFGEVRRPGSYPLKKDVRLLELISEAGGFSDKRGTICHIVRSKKNYRKSGPLALEDAEDNEIITVNLDQLTAGRLGENIKLFPGDSIYINAAAHIFVTGEVKNPGEIKWIRGMTVHQAISSAGGGLLPPPLIVHLLSE